MDSQQVMDWRRQLAFQLVDAGPQLQVPDRTLEQQILDLIAASGSISVNVQWMQACCYWTARLYYGARAAFWCEDQGLNYKRFGLVCQVFERHFGEYVRQRRLLQAIVNQQVPGNANFKLLKDSAAAAQVWPNLSMEHYITCLPLPAAQAFELLYEASTKEWTVQSVRQRLRRMQQRKDPKPVVPKAVVRLLHSEQSSDFLVALVEAVAEAGCLDNLHDALTRVEAAVTAE